MSFYFTPYRAICLLLAVVFAPATQAVQTIDYKYVISLSSTSEKAVLRNIKLPAKIKSKGYKIFLTRVDVNKRTSFYRLRLGFFAKKSEAESTANLLRDSYPKLWVDHLRKSDRKVLKSWISSRSKPATSISNESKLTSRSSKSAVAIMERANNAMADKKYRLAAGLYSKVIRMGKTEQHKKALEFIGVAREKNGQLIHARAEYRKFLKIYPTGADANRVRQRLLALKTVLLRPRKKLRKKKRKFSDWQHFGSVSQYYRNDVFTTDQVETNNATLATTVNYISRKRTSDLNINSQLTATHLYYFNNPVRTNKSRINTMFIEFADGRNNKSIKVGRQSQNKGGVLGNMDGAWMEYRLSPKIKANLVAGYPVNSSLSNISQKNRPFLGINFDIEMDNKIFDYNVFAIKQEVDSITDRQAIGGEVKYHKGTQNHFLLMDYDTYHSELNTIYFLGNWRLGKSTTLIASLSHRKSPILTTSNALVGQLTQSIDSLLQTYTEAELKQFAKDRTATYNSASVSTYFNLSSKWDFNADLTVSNLSGTPASAGVAAVAGTGNEYFYSFQFLSNNLFSYGETMRYQLQHDDTSSFNRTRITVASQFKYAKKWRFRPKLTLESRKSSKGSRTEKIAPALRMDYRFKKNFKVEVDLGYEASKTVSPVATNENYYYFSAGFIWDF